jgi:hypothetical protein
VNITRELGRSAATSFAMSKIPDSALNAYGSGAFAIDQARKIMRGARWTVAGSQAMRTMAGRNQKPTTMVAGEFFHGPSDIQAVIAALSVDFSAFQSDLIHNAVKPDDAAWAISDIVPVIADWRTFVEHQGKSMLAPYMLEWRALDKWRDRLIRLRELARARGIKLDSDGPVPLPQTVWQRAEHGIGSPVDLAFALGKWIVYAALGLMGAASLYSALRTVRNKASATEVI